MRNRRKVMAAVAAATVLAGLAVSVPAGAWSHGVNEVQTAAQDGSVGTGYGPGWVLLSYKANGPMVGYLFAPGFRFADGVVKSASDHMDIRDTADGSAGHPDITRWPWGFAGGSFDGCAYAYGTRKFAHTRTGFASDRCAGGPTVVGSSHADGTPDQFRWWHSERVFCTDQAADPLCSPFGVWSENKGGGLRVARTTAECPAFGNIGAPAAYGSGPAVPRHLLGTVPVGQQVDVRYVAKSRQWVMGKWHGHALAGQAHWAFLPRGCLVPA